MYPKLFRCVTLRHPVFLPIARSWSTSGRLASLRLPLMAMSAPLLDHAAAHLRPVPDHFFIIEEERVDGHRFRRWHTRRSRPIELALRELERDGRARDL